MPGRRCCIPGCKSNFDGREKVSLFRFPKDDLRRNQWLKSIDRKNFLPSDSSVVCERHFSQHFIIRNDFKREKDGTISCVKRYNPKLSDEAFPSIFSGRPSNLPEEVNRQLDYEFTASEDGAINTNLIKKEIMEGDDYGCSVTSGIVGSSKCEENSNENHSYQHSSQSSVNKRENDSSLSFEVRLTSYCM